MANETHTVVIYTQPTCPPCYSQKEFLSDNNVQFIEKNIRADATALQELIDLGSQSTPTTVIDGETVIIGFDPQRLRETLQL